ncbi:uncharacterized protein LOC121520253 [Cheilinus undulatus]|uniref:uncharacterized protein LOC121520253 n=1 Tax=Cheilinus undulatus TaxID=241271 RepID=UPI001BD6C085|nr:uncharacterized protein LOC121520253 [Cheilinus undulatus]
MILLSAVALCCVCSALVTTAAKLQQPSLSLTRRVGEEVSISCGGIDQCDTNPVLWFQKKDAVTFRAVLQIDRKNGSVYKHHQADPDLSAVIKPNSCELQILKVKPSHSATYYCSCWEWSSAHSAFSSRRVLVLVVFTVREYFMIFGSGTRLFVSDDQVVKPVVRVYPAASRSPPEEKRSLLCVSSAMFPPLVRFSWSRRPKKSGHPEELLSADGRQLKLRESGCTASILAVDQRESDSYEYSCSVQHEEKKVKTLAPTGFSVLPVPPSLPPPSVSVYKLRLLLLLYTLLIVKSLVYCCGLFLMTVLRNKKPSTDSRQAG